MENLNTLCWVLAYSLTGAGILLGLVIRFQSGDGKITALILLLLNIFAITLVSFLFSLSLLSHFLFVLLLENALLILYPVLFNLFHKMNNLPFKGRFYTYVYLFLFFTVNLLQLVDLLPFSLFFILYWLLFMVSGFLMARLLKKCGSVGADKGNPLYFFRSLRSAWNLTGLIALLMGICSLIVYYVVPFRKGESYSLFFAFFYCLYNLPILIYFVGVLFFRKSSPTVLDDLTEREREVASLIMEGKKYREIGDELFISLSTVKKHANNIYRKTGASNGRELIRLNIISGTF